MKGRWRPQGQGLHWSFCFPQNTRGPPPLRGKILEKVPDSASCPCRLEKRPGIEPRRKRPGFGGGGDSRRHARRTTEREREKERKRERGEKPKLTAQPKAYSTPLCLGRPPSFSTPGIPGG
ncbi:hypothetical protein JRQ81_016360 [Phrynocephalus forsythii]|uniref:Uncharacterized protein n=1 Tax=Phrynocephalus forsythii TaxID=171643 RepID=A0A9Q1B122_9SAUR|nr:hypothetical protein JRQ81_016360 [Phrynocephalus forsythii]